MRRRQRLALLLQMLLVLIAALLGILTNYATDVDEAPQFLVLLREVAVPGVLVLLMALLIGHLVMYRIDRPPKPKRVWDAQRPPYPGLDAFREDEAAVFFGRDPQAAEVVRRLHETAERPYERFVPVVGSSGSGKSSLIQAGVVPRLRKRRWAVLPVMTPGTNPLGALARSLAEGADLDSSAQALRRLRQSPRALESLVAQCRGGSRFNRVLLVVDQFEELLTLSGDRERDLFLSLISEALRADQRFFVVATVRIEFLRGLLETSHSALFQSPLALGLLARDELVQVVEEPGKLVDLIFEPQLAEEIVDDAGTSDALPMLAYLLQELYFLSGSAGRVTREHYRRLGGVAGAMARQADQVVAEMHGTDRVDLILAVLLKFVTAEGRQVARRKVALHELETGERRIVDAFVDARLLVTGTSQGEPIVQVAHEALFRQWPPLRQEVEARSELLRQRAELERWAVDWQGADRSADYLLTGERLTLAQQWLSGLEAVGQASAAMRDLVAASRRKDHAFLCRVSESVGRHVLANAQLYPELSILLALAALDECVPTPIAERALMSALGFSHLRVVLAGHSDTVRNLAWSPDGTRIVTASRDGTARIWESNSGRALAVLEGHTGMVEMAKWSPDSAKVATASRDQTVRVWDTRTGRCLLTLAGARDVVRGVAWSPDGIQIAGASRDRVVRIWDTSTGALQHELRGHTDNILGIDWAPDGRRLVTASHDRTAIVWDLATLSPHVVLQAHTNFVEGVAWAPDGRLVANSFR
ncbi:WD domain-containing protein, G-beta repeat-containing protein [Sinosporangium album]|uniref:WD domain-containing protein, G-beta repeat-containing protein n=1 Tax=Sinosporangium album TaxID=504805 RepID=A0A1G8C4Z2_9ACTN|nr:WD40 repeat domain-containing protein [Sinosporangium album]SDH40557.1 WD domain-containing protein, G-beta repeat-containing protein [Sinosporangium album]